MAVTIDKLAAINEEQGKQIATLTSSLESLTKQLKRTPANGQPSVDQVFGDRNVIVNPVGDSQGFSFMKMLGLITKQVEPQDAKVELDLHNRLHKCYSREMGYHYEGGYAPGDRAFLAPLSTKFMQSAFVPPSFGHEMRQKVMAGLDGSMDLPDEMNWIRRKHMQEMGYSTKALSWLNELRGGALVAPPEMGELIELLRNKEALINAGARTVPLPPQGRMKYPRQTSASNTFWIGENAPITSSDIGTGEIILQAKKLAVLIEAPNELIRFANPAAEALMRDDMTKSLALGLDLAGLEGQGGDNRPLGIINRQFINRINSSSQTANGDRIMGQDIYRMIAAVEESNVENFEGWIMRPKTLYKYFQLRWDSVAQGDAAGGFLFSLIREAGEGFKPMLGGAPVTRSTQVSQNRAKGTAANLTYILGGQWSQVLIGMFGAIEFSATQSGDTSFRNDQTWVKGILSADVQVRQEAALVLMDNLDTTL